ncbi:unnamed protein product [Nezara viridula]|uniref:Uncharacterized protein n=1 Tax=Nezara viridula TaxID=85310 RepID=A0A9P0MI13_NEZVI|nr:unnamed protein product [Nezara viridula]
MLLILPKKYFQLCSYHIYRIIIKYISIATLQKSALMFNRPQRDLGCLIAFTIELFLLSGSTTAICHKNILI